MLRPLLICTSSLLDCRFTGISVRTHELFLVVFVTRYLDLFTTFYSVYNSVMKILYIVSTAMIIHTIRFKEPIKSTYDQSQDTFLHWRFAVAPCAAVAFFTHLLGSGIAKFDAIELLWTFSIYLESIAILPQLIVLQRYREVENLTGNYVFFMGAYRALYILNWIYRAHTEKGYKHHWVVYFCGVLQTLLYADFFYYYMKSKGKGGKFTLPTTGRK
jgi:ER lumen protein retaining receptor